MRGGVEEVEKRRGVRRGREGERRRSEGVEAVEARRGGRRREEEDRWGRGGVYEAGG